jgi:predicted nucleic acid-binding protein
MNYIIDSTVFIAWMRAGQNPIRRLAPWLRSGALVGCGIIRAEVLRGMIAEPARKEMTLLFEHIPDVPLSTDAWNETAELAWRLDRCGRVLPLPDLAIAICAQRAKATLVTRDRHFRDIPSLVLRDDLPHHD